MEDIRRLRSVDSIYYEIKILDSETAVTKYQIRNLQFDKDVYSVKIGTRLLLDIDDVLKKFGLFK